MRRFLLFLLIILQTNLLFGQISPHLIRFVFDFGEEPLNLNQYYKIGINDSVEINSLRFYISSVELLVGGVPVWNEKNSFHLIDAEVESTQLILLEGFQNIIYDEIKFNIGIDSMTNVNGVMADDLDPTRNMYWTWQSGYINIKLEGHSNLSAERKNEFKFHLGGYQFPFNSLQTLVFKSDPKPIHTVKIDLQKMLLYNDGLVFGHIMSPGTAAIEMSEKFASSLSVN